MHVYSPASVSLFNSVMVNVPLCERFVRSFKTNGIPSLYHAIVIIGPLITLQSAKRNFKLEYLVILKKLLERIDFFLLENNKKSNDDFLRKLEFN